MNSNVGLTHRLSYDCQYSLTSYSCDCCNRISNFEPLPGCCSLLYANLSHGIPARGGTPDAVEMGSSGPWPVTEISTMSGDEASMQVGQ